MNIDAAHPTNMIIVHQTPSITANEMLLVAGQAMPVIQLQVFAQVMIVVLLIMIYTKTFIVDVPIQKQTAVIPVVGVGVAGAELARPEISLSAGIHVAADG